MSVEEITRFGHRIARSYSRSYILVLQFDLLYFILECDLMLQLSINHVLATNCAARNKVIVFGKSYLFEAWEKVLPNAGPTSKLCYSTVSYTSMTTIADFPRMI